MASPVQPALAARVSHGPLSMHAWPAGVLLERQVVFFCPHIGQLSTAVLSMIPLLRPFAWQSMLMPVLPAHDSMLHLLDAPVPFLLGMQVSQASASRCLACICIAYMAQSRHHYLHMAARRTQQPAHAQRQPAGLSRS